MGEVQKVQFSIKAAYAFGASHGLEKQTNEIRDMVIEWDSSYTTSLRKGYLVELFEKHGIFDEFKAKQWTLGNTPAGEKERQRVLRIKEQYQAFLKGEAPEVPPEEEEALLFPLESHLRDFIATNIGNIKPDGLVLHLYVDPSLDCAPAAWAFWCSSSGARREGMLPFDRGNFGTGRPAPSKWLFFRSSARGLPADSSRLPRGT